MTKFFFCFFIQISFLFSLQVSSVFTLTHSDKSTQTNFKKFQKIDENFLMVISSLLDLQNWDFEKPDFIEVKQKLYTLYDLLKSEDNFFVSFSRLCKNKDCVIWSRKINLFTQLLYISDQLKFKTEKLHLDLDKEFLEDFLVEIQKYINNFLFDIAEFFFSSLQKRLKDKNSFVTSFPHNFDPRDNFSLFYMSFTWIMKAVFSGFGDESLHTRLEEIMTIKLPFVYNILSPFEKNFFFKNVLEILLEIRKKRYVLATDVKIRLFISCEKMIPAFFESVRPFVISYLRNNPQNDPFSISQVDLINTFFEIIKAFHLGYEDREIINVLNEEMSSISFFTNRSCKEDILKCLQWKWASRCFPERTKRIQTIILPFLLFSLKNFIQIDPLQNNRSFFITPLEDWILQLSDYSTNESLFFQTLPSEDQKSFEMIVEKPFKMFIRETLKKLKRGVFSAEDLLKTVLLHNPHLFFAQSEIFSKFWEKIIKQCKDKKLKEICLTFCKNSYDLYPIDPSYFLRVIARSENCSFMTISFQELEIPYLEDFYEENTQINIDEMPGKYQFNGEYQETKVNKKIPPYSENYIQLPQVSIEIDVKEEKDFSLKNILDSLNILIEDTAEITFILSEDNQDILNQFIELFPHLKDLLEQTSKLSDEGLSFYVKKLVIKFKKFSNAEKQKIFYNFSTSVKLTSKIVKNTPSFSDLPPSVRTSS